MAHKPGTPPKADLPPYFNIDPAEAAEKLSAPIDTARFAKAAAFAMRLTAPSGCANSPHGKSAAT